MGERKDTTFTDPDVHLLRTDCYTRLRKAIENLSKLAFSKSTINTMVLSFVPHLKRKDRDCGGLPFYSRQYTSTKPHKEHALVCLISMLVQVWWDINDGTIELEEKSEFVTAELDRFEVNLATLEGIAASGLDAYRLHGKMPNIRLVTLQEVADLEAAETDTEGLKAERAECDKVEDEQQQAVADETEAKGLMDAELGESTSSTVETGSSDDTQKDETVTSDSDQSSSTDADQLSAEDADMGGAEAKAAYAVADETEAKGLMDAELGESQESTDTQQEGSSEASSSDQQVATDSNDADQLSVEDADACCGDCDSCAHESCPADAVDLEGAEAKAAYAAGSVNDSESYPDPEPLEQTIKDAQEAIPPIPDDQDDEEPGAPDGAGNDCHA